MRPVDADTLAARSREEFLRRNEVFEAFFKGAPGRSRGIMHDQVTSWGMDR